MKQRLGWHNLFDDLSLFHAAVKQMIGDMERVLKESRSLNQKIEAVIDCGEEGNGADSNGH